MYKFTLSVFEDHSQNDKIILVIQSDSIADALIQAELLIQDYTEIETTILLDRVIKIESI